MARPCKLTPEIQQKIGDSIALGLTYRLAAQSVGITYKTLNEWNQKGQIEKSGKYFEFSQYIQKCNADGALNILQRLNDSAKAGDTRICMWILERRFPVEFGRRLYRKTDALSENINANVEITVQEMDILRKQILTKLDRF